MSFRLKFERGLHHLDAVEALERDWIEGKGYRVAVEVGAEPGEQIARCFFNRPIPADELSLLVGDCVHNLRAALDHLVFDLAIAHSGTIPDDVIAGLQFPVYGPFAPDSKQLDRRLWGVHPGARAVIEALQPHHMGDHHLGSPLWMLHMLDIVDKHRALHFVAFASQGLVLKMGGNWSLRGGTHFEPRALEDGAEIARFNLVAKDPTKPMDMEFGVPIRISFSDDAPGYGNPVVPLLRWAAKNLEDQVFSPLAGYLQMLTADGATGIHEVRLSLTDQDGNRIGERTERKHFRGHGLEGVEWKIEAVATVSSQGTVWGQVEVGEFVLTRTPLELILVDSPEQLAPGVTLL